MKPTISRRGFVTGLGMLSVPLIAFAQDKKEEKKKEAKEKKDEAKGRRSRRTNRPSTQASAFDSRPNSAPAML